MAALCSWGAPKYIQQDCQGLHLPRDAGANWGGRGEEMKVQMWRLQRALFKGPLASGRFLPGSQREWRKAGRRGGRRSCIQAAAASGHGSTSVFRLLEKKNPPKPRHTPCHRLFDTKFQDSWKNPKCFLILLGKEGG